MKKSTLLVGSLLLLLLVGCASGPNYLSTKADDWRNRNYEKSPLATAVLTDLVPFYPFVTGLARIPDVWVLNPIQFWVIDVWRGRGVAAMHSNPEGGETPWFVRRKGDSEE